MSHCVRPTINLDLPAGAEEESCFPMDEQIGDKLMEGETEEDLHGGEDSGEVQAARKVNQPRMPSDRERREHELTHVRTAAGASIASAPEEQNTPHRQM